MTINLRLIIGFSVILFMMVVLTIISIHRVNFIDSTISEITDVNSVKQRYAINFRGSVHDRAIAVRDVVFSRNNNELNKEIDSINKLDDFYQESASSMNGMLSSSDSFTAEEKSIYAKINEIEKKSIASYYDKSLMLKNQVMLKKANQILLDQARPLFVDWLATINQFIDYQEAVNQQATKEVRSVASSFQNWMVSLTAIAIVLGGLTAYRIISQIRDAVGGDPQQAAKVVARISKGDLTGEINSCCPDSMMASVGVMQQQLKRTVNSIIHSSGELSDRAISVTAGSLQALTAADKQVTQTTQAKR